MSLLSVQDFIGRENSTCRRSLPQIENGALIEIVKGVIGLPDSPRGWWKELRDTLEGDSWNSLKLDPAFFCLSDFSEKKKTHRNDHRTC